MRRPLRGGNNGGARIDLVNYRELDSESPHRSDRATLEGLTQFSSSSRHARHQTIGTTEDVESDMREGRFCARLSGTARNSLILNGEMSEWSIEHAWKSDRFTRADAHQNPPTHVRSTTSRNNERLRD